MLPFAVVVAIVVDYRLAHPVSRWRTASAVALCAVGTVARPVILGVREGSVDACAFSQSAWGRTSIPFAETVQWLRSEWPHPTVNTVVAVVLLVVYCAAAVVVGRDREVPVAVRALAVASPVFVIASGAPSSTGRYLLPGPGVAIALRTWVTRTWALAAIIAPLVALHAGWVLAYVAVPAGSPPP